MKSIKPVMLVVSGMALACIFAFKVNTNESVKEYITILNISKINSTNVIIYFPDQTEKVYSSEISSHKELNKMLNDLSKDRWKLVNTIGGPGYSMLYLERDKQ